MRYLFVDTETYSCTEAKFRITAVLLSDLTTPANRRSVWIRMTANADQLWFPSVYVTKTKAEAAAITGYLASDEEREAAGVIAYCNVGTNITSPETLTFTDQDGVDPDFTGFKIRVNGSELSGDTNYMAGYIASPGGEVLSQIESILEDRMGSGQILEGYTAATCVKGPESFAILGQAKNIAAAVASEDEINTAVNYFGVSVNFAVLIGRQAIPRETGYAALLQTAGEVRSVLADELRTLNGLCADLVIGAVQGPEEVMGEGEPYMVARITGRANFFTLTSDA